MEIEEYVNLSLLLDTYKCLLTEKEANVLDMYVNSNMSYLEIANELGITKTAVMCFVKSAEEKLRKYEQCLNLTEIRMLLAKAESLDNINEIKLIINKILKGS